LKEYYVSRNVSQFPLEASGNKLQPVA